MFGDTEGFHANVISSAFATVRLAAVAVVTSPTTKTVEEIAIRLPIVTLRIFIGALIESSAGARLALENTHFCLTKILTAAQS